MMGHKEAETDFFEAIKIEKEKYGR